MSECNISLSLFISFRETNYYYYYYNWNNICIYILLKISERSNSSIILAITIVFSFFFVSLVPLYFTIAADFFLKSMKNISSPGILCTTLYPSNFCIRYLFVFNPFHDTLPLYFARWINRLSRFIEILQNKSRVCPGRRQSPAMTWLANSLGRVFGLIKKWNRCARTSRSSLDRNNSVALSFFPSFFFYFFLFFDI